MRQVASLVSTGEVQLAKISMIQCNLAIRNPRYKEQLGYKELFSDFFFYVMGFLDIRNKFGIFSRLKNLAIRNDSEKLKTFWSIFVPVH